MAIDEHELELLMDHTKIRGFLIGHLGQEFIGERGAINGLRAAIPASHGDKKRRRTGEAVLERLLTAGLLEQDTRDHRYIRYKVTPFATNYLKDYFSDTPLTHASPEREKIAESILKVLRGKGLPEESIFQQLQSDGDITREVLQQLINFELVIPQKSGFHITPYATQLLHFIEYRKSAENARQDSENLHFINNSHAISSAGWATRAGIGNLSPQKETREP